MTPTIKIERNNISPSIRRYAAAFKVGLRDVVRQTAKGITRRVADMTPPANGATSGREARKAGEEKIFNQMSAVFAPKKLKGRRLITHAWGRKLKRPRYVTTTERHPDVAGIYHGRLKASGTGVGFSTGRVRQKLFVDVRKFTAVLKARQANVGKLAAGWGAAAAALDVPLQQWIKRHGSSRGRVRIDTAGDRMLVTTENIAPGLPSNVRSELARRIPYAVEYQANAMTRAIEGYHQRIKQQNGIRGRARVGA
jgi:hypothetical protein